MRFPYLTADPSQSELDSLPWLPLMLRYGQRQIAEVGLVDSGATVNVLPLRQFLFTIILRPQARRGLIDQALQRVR